MDLTEYTDEQLNELEQALAEERDRRYIMEKVPEQIEQMIASYQVANGLGQGEEWVQPTGVHDAYRIGAVVTRNGKTWESLTPANAWEPGVSGWREAVAEGAEPAEWVQPTGAHDPYKKGDRVTYNGVVYESIVDGNVWSPSAYGWKKI